MTPFAVKNFAHSFASLNGVFCAINADRWFAAGKTNPLGFFPHHVDLLARHGSSVGFHQTGEFIHNFFSTPRF